MKEAHDGDLLLRCTLVGSALLSLVGACVIIMSHLRFRELAKRFFAIRLIFFLALTNATAAALNIVGAFIGAGGLLGPDGALPILCGIQAIALLYVNLASIMWTSCFAYTLYRDVVPSSHRYALRKYEEYYHALCWPLPALLAGSVALFGAPPDGASWCDGCALRRTRASLVCFFVPLLLAVGFNLLTWCAVARHASERRVSRITSLYLLGLALVWLPTLLRRASVLLGLAAEGSHGALPYGLALLEAACMPLQGALNALVYGWSLPAIRDVYRTMLLGTDGGLVVTDVAPNGGARVGAYAPPEPVSGGYGYAALPAAAPVCNGVSGGAHAAPNGGT